LPVLARAKESARSVRCVSNLHQIAVATATYTSDQKGRLPWFQTWLFATTTLSRDFSTGNLFPYLNSKSIYMCPTDEYELSLKPAVVNQRKYSYGMSCGICHANEIDKFREADQTMIYMEGNMIPTDNTGIVGPTGWFSTTQALALRHRKRGHLAM